MTTNSAKGRFSFDANIGGQLVNFVNRNVSTYPTDVGSPQFDLVPVTNQKDLMINTARMHAQQEYDRIMQLVTVLQQQAEDIKRRLDITDMVHAAEYNFKLYPGNYYWLINNTSTSRTELVQLGPRDWSTGSPSHYEYICCIQWLGDYTWRQIDVAI